MDDGAILVRGSLVAIMGRLAADSGRMVRWDEMLAATPLPAQFAMSAKV
jgi:hypothetical protein